MLTNHMNKTLKGHRDQLGLQVGIMELDTLMTIKLQVCQLQVKDQQPINILGFLTQGDQGLEQEVAKQVQVLGADLIWVVKNLLQVINMEEIIMDQLEEVDYHIPKLHKCLVVMECFRSPSIWVAQAYKVEQVAQEDMAQWGTNHLVVGEKTQEEDINFEVAKLIVLFY